MKVSVIIPVFNGEKYINKCLDSLVNQTLKDIEIIVVDDGSTDNTKEIVNSYKDKRIKYYFRENKGQATARNYGLSLAKGLYISFIDSDDYVDINMFETLYNYSLKNESDICVCSYNIVYSDHAKVYSGDIYKDPDNITPNEYLLFSPSPCNKLYKKEYLLKNNFKFKEGIIYEDFCSVPLLALNNPRICYFNKPLNFFVQSENSTTRNNIYKEKYEDIFLAVDYLVSNLKNKGFDTELEYILIDHFLYQASLNFYHFEKYEMIDKISNYMRNNYKNYKKNKYFKRLNFKARLLTNLFYLKKYNLIKLVQRIKGTI